MRKELASYLPSILLETYEFPLLCRTEQPEIDALHRASDEVLEAQFVATASARGLERYERIWGIFSRDTDSLEERRLRLLSRMSMQLPYTLRRLREMLTLLCGSDGFTLKLVYESYALVVRVELSARKQLGEVEALLRRMVPANLALDFSLNYPHFTSVGVIGCMGKGYMETALPEIAYRMEGMELYTGGVFASIVSTSVPQAE